MTASDAGRRIRGPAAASAGRGLSADRHGRRRRGHRPGRLAAVGWPGRPSEMTITDLRAWLTTVVSRLCLDRLRSAAHRRETYVGEWLPEPVVTGFDGNDPLARWWRARTPGSPRWSCWSVDTGSAGGVRAARRIRGAVRRDRRRCWASAMRGAAVGLSGATGGHVRTEPGAPTTPTTRSSGELMAALAAGDMDAVVRLLHPEVDVHRGLQPQGADGGARHPRPGQGRAVPVRAGPPLRAELAVGESAGSGQRPARQLHRRRAGRATAIRR